MNVMVTLAIPKERTEGERRVAATPETIKKFITLGFKVTVEEGAGAPSLIPDQAYQDAGASLVPTPDALYAKANLILKVRPPRDEESSLIPEKAFLVGLLGGRTWDPQPYASREVCAFSLELLPRISRAQSMDVLSSQATLMGYWAVIEAAHRRSSLFPLLMTAAGTIPPTRVLILGAGVAGLQAIATAKRLGALVTAFDVRSAAREQVESLGGTFLKVDTSEEGEGQGGYARELTPEAERRNLQAIQAVLPQMNVVICTAQIPGKPAPCLLTAEMVACLKPGSVVIDLAAETGGNCALTRAGKTITHQGVSIVGTLNVPSLLPVDASALYARNLWHFVGTLFDKETGAFRDIRSDELLQATCVTHPSSHV